MPTLKDVMICTVDFTVADWHPAVSSVTLELKAGGIPTASLVIDPKHTPEEPNTPATESSLDMLAVTFAKAKSYVEKPNTVASLTITIKDKKPASAELNQEIKLTGWIVTGAGITGVSATGQFAVEITIQHPIGKLDRSLGTLGNTTGKPDWKSDTYEDIVNGLMQSYEAWAKVLRVAPTTTDVTCVTIPTKLEDAFKAAKTALEKKAAEITKYLKWVTEWPNNQASYTKWPFENGCLASAQSALKHAFNVYATTFGDMSIWAVLTNSIMDEFQLTIMPTYWEEQLQLTPVTPWGMPTVTIYDDQISDISFPGVDPAPIGGVRISYDPSQDSFDYSYFAANSQDVESEHQGTEVVYLPPASLTSLCGRVINLSSPHWWNGTMRSDSAANGDTQEAGNKEDKGGLLTTEDIFIEENYSSDADGKATPVSAEFVGALYGIANQFFLASFQSQIETSFMTYLMMQSPNSSWPGGYVVPGCVVRLQSRKSGKVLFDTYIHRIIHVLNTSTRQASTEWLGVFCRPEEGYPGMAKNGTWNPMYLKK